MDEQINVNNVEVVEAAVKGGATKKILYVFLGLIVIAIIAIVLFEMNRNNDDAFVSTVENAGTKFDSGDVSGSIADLEAYLAGNLSDEVRANALISLASAYAQKGSLEFKEAEYSAKAISAVNASLLLVPNISEAYRVMAYAHEITENYADAIPNYEKAISLDAENAEALSGLGHAYDLKGDLVKAKENYEKALAIDSTLDYAEYNLAKVLYRAGDVKSAVAHATNVINNSSNGRFIAESHLLIALNQADEKKFTESIISLNKAIESDPTLANLYVALAEVKIASVSPSVAGLDVFLEKSEATAAEALTLVDKALSLNSNLVAAYVSKAKILMLSDRGGEAITVLNQALNVLPNDITLGVAEKESAKIEIRMNITSYTSQLDNNKQ